MRSHIFLTYRQMHIYINCKVKNQYLNILNNPNEAYQHIILNGLAYLIQEQRIEKRIERIKSLSKKARIIPDPVTSEKNMIAKI